MNIEETLIKKLERNGLFNSQATSIIEKFKKNTPSIEEHTWKDQFENLPSCLFDILWLSLKKETLEWLEENAPEHWAKPMFV